MMSANWAVSENLISIDTHMSAWRITLMAVGRLPRVCMKFEFVANMMRGFTGISRAAWYVGVFARSLAGSSPEPRS